MARIRKSSNILTVRLIFFIFVVSAGWRRYGVRMPIHREIRHQPTQWLIVPDGHKAVLGVKALPRVY